MQVHTTNVLELASKEGSLLALFKNRVPSNTKTTNVPALNLSKVGGDYILNAPNPTEIVVGGATIVKQTLSRSMAITDETVEDTNGIINQAMVEKVLASAIKADLNHAIIKETVEFSGIAQNAATIALAEASWDGIEAGYDLLNHDALSEGIILALSPVNYLKLVGDKTLEEAEASGMIKATMTSAVDKAMAISQNGWIVIEPTLTIHTSRKPTEGKTIYAYSVTFGIAPTANTALTKLAVSYT